MTRRITNAAGGQDWEALRQNDSALASLLAVLAQHGDLSAAERMALEELRTAHRRAGEQCDRELARLNEYLADLRANKAGWLAYAETEETGL